MQLFIGYQPLYTLTCEIVFTGSHPECTTLPDPRGTVQCLSQHRSSVNVRAKITKGLPVRPGDALHSPKAPGSARESLHRTQQKCTGRCDA